MIKLESKTKHPYLVHAFERFDLVLARRYFKISPGQMTLIAKEPTAWCDVSVKLFSDLVVASSKAALSAMNNLGAEGTNVIFRITEYGFLQMQPQKAHHL